MPDTETLRSLSLTILYAAQAVGASIFELLALWAWLWARGLARRRRADPHAVFLFRLSTALLILGLALALPALFRPPGGGPREAAEACRSGATLGCGLVALLFAGVRRDAQAVGSLEARIKELEGDLGSLVRSVADFRGQLEAAKGKVEAAASIDPSTGLFSRRFFDDVIGRELKRAKRHERTMSLAIAEVDFLARYEQSFGRQATEQLMQTIAKLMQGQVRDTDLLVRYGPNRFAILMPETDLEKAGEVADWVRSMVSNSPFPNRAEMPGQRVSLSVGVGSFPAPLDDPGTFLAAVEGALEKAAQEKNRMKVAP